LKALVDGDIITYRSGFAGNDKVEASLGNAKLLLKNVLDEVNASGYQVYLTAADRSNFRYERAKTQEYKGNRKNAPKPKFYKEIREYLVNHWGAQVIYNQEADDALGINQDQHTIVCSIDKDLNMIPGWHYNFVKKEKYFIDDDDPLNFTTEVKSKRTTYKMDRGGIKWFYAQMLLGDTGDNIPGVRGYGPVKVYETLKDCFLEDDMISSVWEVYERHKLTYERFLEVADLLWIRRYEGQVKSEEINK
jgi:hypothetical protein